MATKTSNNISTKTGNFKVSNSPTATQGTSSAANRSLQMSLNAKGANLAVDGKYGPATAAAFKTFGGGGTNNSGNSGNSNNLRNTGNTSTNNNSNVITPNDLRSTNTLNLPFGRNPSAMDFTTMTNSANASTGFMKDKNGGLVLPPQTGAPGAPGGVAPTAISDLLTSLNASFNNAPSQESMFMKARENSQLVEKQNMVSTLTGQLNQITASGQANQLSTVGQGRGIPEAILGGQQAQFARETAIQSLPVAAQLAAAQGNLEMAQQNVNTLFSIYTKDAENKRDFYNNQAMAIYGDASKKEQAILDANIRQKEREYAKSIADDKTKEDMILNAFSQGASSAITTKALAVVTKKGSPLEVAKALGVYSGDYLGNEAKRASIRSSNASAANSNASAAKTRAEQGLLGTPGSGKPPTEGQVLSAGFAERTKQANDIIDSKADMFKKMSYVDFKLAESKSQIANAFMSPDVRQAAQAMRNFITAKLRKESGAAIAQSEFDDARVQYFPAYKDDATTLANKKTLRDSVLNNLITGAGSAYTPPLPVTNGVAPSGNTWSLPSAWGKINNGQGVTTSGHSFTIIP